MYVYVLCVCIQTEKKTEEHYKKQHTAVFKSATERLALLAKVSLFPLCLPASLTVVPVSLFLILSPSFCCKAVKTYLTEESMMK